jgi:uncharacterized MnhB-related membrane protein
VEAIMTGALGFFDALLTVTLIFLAWRSLTTADLFRAVVFLMIFGLLMAVTWSRLQAPDVALAEAAIGAGLTGALFLDTLGRMRGLDEGSSRGKTKGAQQ